MIWIARFLRGTAKARFRILGLATVKDIPGDKFKELASVLKAQGWRVSQEYSGIDAGLDYNCIRLRRGLRTLKCEWDNWSEWSVEGPRIVVEAVAAENNLKVSYAWRWGDYDRKRETA
jgi:hypothetical protein